MSSSHFYCDILPHPTPLTPLRLLECRPEVTGAVQAEQSKGTSTLPSYHFSYSREAVSLLTNFCTPKAHVSVSHTSSPSPTPPDICTYCYPSPVSLMSPASTVILLSPAPTVTLCHSHVTCTSCHPPVTLMSPAPTVTVLFSSSCHSSCHPPVNLLSPQEGRQYWLTRFVAHTLEWLLAVYKMVEAHAADGSTYAVPTATHTYYIQAQGCGGTVVQGNPTSVTHSTSLPKAYIISYMHTCTSAV